MVEHRTKVLGDELPSTLIIERKVELCGFSWSHGDATNARSSRYIWKNDAVGRGAGVLVDALDCEGDRVPDGVDNKEDRFFVERGLRAEVLAMVVAAEVSWLTYASDACSAYIRAALIQLSGSAS